MPFSLSLSAVHTCMFDREESIVAQVISFTIPAVCLGFTKQKHNYNPYNLLKNWSRSHDRWADPSRCVARSATLGNPLSRGQILPCQVR